MESQFSTKSNEISSIITTASISSKNCSFTSSELVTAIFLVDPPLLFTNFMRYMRDLAQFLVISIDPPFFDRSMRLLDSTIAVPIAMVNDIVTNPPSSRKPLCTLVPVYHASPSPKSNGCPLFADGKHFTLKSISPAFLFFSRSNLYFSTEVRILLSFIGISNLLLKCLIAKQFPFSTAYFAISAFCSSVSFRYVPLTTCSFFLNSSTTLLAAIIVTEGRWRM